MFLLPEGTSTVLMTPLRDSDFICLGALLASLPHMESMPDWPWELKGQVDGLAHGKPQTIHWVFARHCLLLRMLELSGDPDPEEMERLLCFYCFLLLLSFCSSGCALKG